MLDPDGNAAELQHLRVLSGREDIATSTSDRLKVASGQNRTVSIDQTFLEDVESIIAQSEAQRLTKDDESDEDIASLVEAKTAARDKFRWLTSSALAQFSSFSFEQTPQKGSGSLNEGHETGFRRRTTPRDKDGNNDDGLEVTRSSSRKSASTYLAACSRYSLTPNGGALLGLSLGLEMLEVDGSISNLDLVPLFAALLEAPFVYCLKLSGHALQDTGASVLALALPGCPWIRELELSRCRITGVGVRALCEAIPKSGVTQLVLRGNLLRQSPQPGNQALASVVGRARQLKEVDLQSCGLTSQGMRLIKQSLVERGKRGCPCCTVSFEGNFVLVEVLNSLTHGICALVSLEAWRMLNRLTIRLCHLESRVALTLYMVSMTLMFLGSTLYHSMFAVTDLSWFFKMIDHCAIYILIAGTYTPVLVMGCRNNRTMEIQGTVFLVVLIYWVVVVVGIVMEHIFAAKKATMVQQIHHWYVPPPRIWRSSLHSWMSLGS